MTKALTSLHYTSWSGLADIIKCILDRLPFAKRYDGILLQYGCRDLSILCLCGPLQRPSNCILDFIPVEKIWKLPLAQDDSNITPVHYSASMNPPDALKCVFDCVPCDK